LRVKICGITRAEDALLAESLGAWGVGFIFIPRSPRKIEAEAARKISEKLGSGTERVGVFEDLELEEAVRAAQESAVTLLQLHGAESDEYARLLKKRTGLPLLRAISAAGESATHAEMVLFESFSKGARGGSGEVGDWAEAAKAVKLEKRPVFLAGGLRAENVLQALGAVAAAGLDLSSGVEEAPGIKSEAKLRRFFDTLRSR
jgi:phosphoribosylanthranilate isomerase